MKKHTYWKLVGLVVIVAGIALLAGCAEAGAGGGGGGNDGATAAEASAALSTAFGEFDAALGTFDPDNANNNGLPGCVELVSADDPFEVSFNNCTADGVTVNGSLSMSVSDGNLVLTANLTLSGAQVSSLQWSLLFGEVFTGSVTADGSTYNLDELDADLTFNNPPSY